MLAALPFLFLADPVADLQAILDRNAKLPYEQRVRARAIRDLGRIGSAASTAVLIGLLDDPFAHQRDNAVSALIGLKKQPATERKPSIALLAKAARKSAHAVTALGLIGDPSAVPALTALLSRYPGPVSTALSRIGGDAAVDALRKGTGKPKTRAACVRALGYHAGQEAFVRRFAEDAEDSVRAAVVDALARRKSPPWPRENPGELQGIALADALVDDKALAKQLLAHSSWRVRAAAIAGVERCRKAEWLELLVERLGAERGRLRFDAWMALRRLTGKQIPPDPEQWRAIRELGEPADWDPKERQTTAYFGLPVPSERIAFVFDVSGSMRDDNKMERAREQFAAIRFGKEQRFDLFAYRYLLDYPPRPKLERAFGKLVAGKNGRPWLGKQAAKGGGAIYDALLAAMQDPEVDTIYLLSDGVPSYGTVSRDYRVLQEVRRHNRWRRVAIHTILLGSKGTDRKFMRSLAAQNGGIAVDAAGQPLR